MNKDNKEKSADLRKKAEKMLTPKSVDINNLSDEDIRKLAHELQVHQIELEMQNEELRKAQVELQDSRDKYSSLYHIAPVGYLTISNKGIILEANLTGAEILGVNRSELIGKPLGLFVTKEYGDVFYLQRKEVCIVKGKSGAREIVMKKANGTQFYAQLQCKAAQDAGRSNAECLTIMSDITERKKAELELQEYRNHLETLVEQRTRELKNSQAQLVRNEKMAAIGKVSSSIARELRNPLAVMQNASYYLGAVLKDSDDKVKKHLALIYDAVVFSDNIINSFVDLILARSMSLVKSDINKIIEHNLYDCKTAENINIKTQLDEQLPVIELDKNQIFSVFKNIISNALQAMPEGGSLDIKTEVKDDFVEVEFKDTGTGISKDNIQKIYEPLFTTKTNALGLGLTKVKAIIDEHKGSIFVNSEIGQGTTFTVKLSILGHKNEKEAI